MVKGILKALLVFVLLVLLLVAALALLLTVTEYKPDDVQPADRLVGNTMSGVGQTLSVCSWNIGYAGLGCESDFFMDGGEMVDPPSQETVEKNIEGIKAYMQNNPADIWLLQEVDTNSARTDGMDQFEQLCIENSGAAFAYNYKCPFVPIPVPPMGRVESGIATISNLGMYDNAQRISLPCPFSWPMRTANIKRCLLVTRISVIGSTKELVVINLHLEAYESGEGRIAQTKKLIELMQAEYAAGNYVIAGGDFNQTFPGALDLYPIKDSEKWMPGTLDESVIPEGWSFAYDSTTATCRLLDKPYSEDSQLYVIDGYILSPNVRLDLVQTVDLGFTHSDHNPVRLGVTLLP